MGKIFLIATTLFALILTSCSTASVRLLPGSKGVHKVLVRDIELEDAEEAAVKAAKDYCEERDQEAVFVKQKSNYTGKMDESTRKGVRAASDAVNLIPGAGLISSMGKAVVNDRDYFSGALFKCQAVN